MGKVKRCSRGRRERCRPTGLPSLQQTERGEKESVPEVTLPLLEKLSSTEVAEREWACRSVAHLLCERDTQQTLLNYQGLPRSLIPHLLDPEWSVREAAAGAIRNLSSVGGENMCETLVRDDVMTALSAVLRQCMAEVQRYYPVAVEKVPDALPTPPSPVPPPHSHTHTPSSLHTPSPSVRHEGKSKGKGKDKDDVGLHHVLTTVEQTLHLLLNISEGCSAVVGVANREELVPVLIYFLQPSIFFPDILTTAAMCLYTVTEDNPPSHHILTSSPSHMALLETLLHAPPPSSPTDHPLDQKHSVVLSTVAAGVFQRILPSLPGPPPSQLISSVFSVLVSVLDNDVASLLTTLTSTPPHTPPQSESGIEDSVEDRLDTVLSEAESVLTAQSLALEITANFCYTESDEGEWEDVEEEEVIGGDLSSETVTEEEEEEGPMELDPTTQAPEWLRCVLVETGMVERVWRKCTSSLVSPLPHHFSSITDRWAEVQTRGMAALQNMLSALPASATPPNSTLTMWKGVLDMAAGSKMMSSEGVATTSSEGVAMSPGGVATMMSSVGVGVCEGVTGLLAVLVERMREQDVQCIGVDQLEVLSAACRKRLASHQHTQSVVDILLIMACVGRHSLHFPPTIQTPLLEVVGRTLRDSMSGGGSVWVVARALDTLYDVFGSDKCPPHLFSHLQIMPVLQSIAAQLPKQAGSITPKELGPTLYGEVVCARDNLLPFIEYMSSRTATNH